MKRTILSIALLSATLFAQPLFAQTAERVPSTNSSVALSDPASDFRAIVRAVRNNDIAALVRAAIPASKYQEMETAYELHRAKAHTDEERARFTEKWSKFIAADAVDQWMAHIEPKLVEARPKAAGALLMGFGGLQIALASDDTGLTETQREQLEALIPGLQKWAGATDFLSSVSMRQAASFITDAARNTGIRSIDDFRNLSLQEAFAKAKPFLLAGKQSLSLYGLNVNQILDTLQVEVLSVQGSSARIKTTITVFDAPISAEHEMQLVEGHWYGKEAVVDWQKRRSNSTKKEEVNS